MEGGRASKRFNAGDLQAILTEDRPTGPSTTTHAPKLLFWRKTIFLSSRQTAIGYFSEHLLRTPMSTHVDQFGAPPGRDSRMTNQTPEYRNSLKLYFRAGVRNYQGTPKYNNRDLTVKKNVRFVSTSPIPHPDSIQNQIFQD